MGKLKVFEAFAGIGCQRIALRNLGLDYESVGISEVDRYAIIGYDAIHNQQFEVEKVSKGEMISEIKKRNIAYNFSTNKSEIPKKDSDLKKLYNSHIRSKNHGDIRLIDPNDLPDFDLFTYSPPCKNISIAGGQDGFDKDSGTQSSLLWECEKIIREKRPKYLLFENVKNIVGKNHIDNFNQWCEILESYGYINHWKILNGCDFGVPQNRERCIMFSVLKNYDKGIKLPNNNANNKTIKDILEDEVDDKYILAKCSHKQDILNTLLDTIIYNYDKLNDDNEYNQLLQIGMLNHKGNQSTRRVYAYNGLCPTLNSMNGGNRQPKILLYKNNEYVIRKMTPLECWRTQGLSDDLYYRAKNIGKLCDSKLYERSGRTIVIPMLEEILKVYLKEYIYEDDNKSRFRAV